jgi:hypothetical protein
MKKTEKELGEELKELKAKHESKKIYQLDVFLDDEEDEEYKRTVFLVKPNRIVRTAGENMVQKDSFKALEVYLRGMYIGGDDVAEIIKNDDAMVSIGEPILDIISVKKGNITRV